MSQHRPPVARTAQPPRLSRSLLRPVGAVLLTAGLLMPAALGGPAAAASAQPAPAQNGVIDLPIDDIDGPDVRFAAVGDIHDQWGELGEAYDFWVEQDVQATMLVGDLTDAATSAEYDALKQALESNADVGIPAITSMGNHDVSDLGSYDRFSEATGGQKPNAHYTVGGYHVITVSPGAGALDPATGKPSIASSDDYAYAKSWLRDELVQATADEPTKPVMVMVHHPLRCTHYVSEEWNGKGLATGCGDDFASVFDEFPQAVVWGGHIHTPQNIPTSIWQGQEGRAEPLADKGFTSVNAPPLVYYEFESGVIGTNPTSRSSDTTPDDAGDNRQTAIVEITGSRVTIKNYDLLADEWIDQTWTWDVADSLDTSKSYDERFPYNNGVRAAQASGPVWPAGSAVSVDEISGTKAMVSFPQAVPAANTVDDIVHKYRYTTVDVATGQEVNSFRQWSGFYNLPMPAGREHEVWNLLPGREYEVRITPVNAWGEEGDALTTRFVSGEEQTEPPFDPSTLTFEDLVEPVPTADLLDLEIAHGEVSDVSAAGRALTAGGAASIEEDAELGAEVIVGAQGRESAVRTDAWTDADYELLQDGFTLDTTFRLDSIDGGFIDVFGGMQGGGVGLEAVEISPTSYELQFWYASPRPAVTLEYGQWYHVSAWYDGRDARLYVDGVRKAEAEGVSFNVTPGAADARYMAIGGDANPSGSLSDATMNGRIAGAEVHSAALSDGDIYRVATRELTSLDTVAPLLRVDPEPDPEATLDESFAVPTAQAVDNSGEVTSDVSVTDPSGAVIEIDRTGDDTGSSFIPEKAGEYSIVYTARDAAGLTTELVFAMTAAETGAPGDGSTPGEDGQEGEGGQGGDKADGAADEEGSLALTGAGLPMPAVLLAVIMLVSGITAVAIGRHKRHARERT